MRTSLATTRPDTPECEWVVEIGPELPHRALAASSHVDEPGGGARQSQHGAAIPAFERNSRCHHRSGPVRALGTQSGRSR